MTSATIKILSLLALNLLMCIIPAPARSTIRAAIDVGSGGPKLRVAEVDLSTNRIARIIHIQEYPVAFQDALSRSDDGTLNAEIIHQGLECIKAAIVTARSFEAEGVVIIGASIFRNAENGEQFAHAIHAETGLSIHILDQDLEGKLAFQFANGICRKRLPSIMGDAAYELASHTFKEYTGQFFIDEALLRKAEIVDFSHYAVDPSVPLMQPSSPLKKG